MLAEIRNKDLHILNKRKNITHDDFFIPLHTRLILDGAGSRKPDVEDIIFNDQEVFASESMPTQYLCDKVILSELEGGIGLGNALEKNIVLTHYSNKGKNNILIDNEFVLPYISISRPQSVSLLDYYSVPSIPFFSIDKYDILIKYHSYISQSFSYSSLDETDVVYKSIVEPYAISKFVEFYDLLGRNTELYSNLKVYHEPFSENLNNYREVSRLYFDINSINKKENKPIINEVNKSNNYKLDSKKIFYPTKTNIIKYQIKHIEIDIPNYKEKKFDESYNKPTELTFLKPTQHNIEIDDLFIGVYDLPKISLQQISQVNDLEELLEGVDLKQEELLNIDVEEVYVPRVFTLLESRNYQEDKSKSIDNKVIDLHRSSIDNLDESLIQLLTLEETAADDYVDNTEKSLEMEKYNFDVISISENKTKSYPNLNTKLLKLDDYKHKPLKENNFKIKINNEQNRKVIDFKLYHEKKLKEINNCDSLSSCYGEKNKDIIKARSFIPKRKDVLEKYQSIINHNNSNYKLKAIEQNGKIVNGLYLTESFLINPNMAADDYKGKYALRVIDEMTGEEDIEYIPNRSAYALIDKQLQILSIQEGRKITPVWVRSTFRDVENKITRTGVYLYAIAEYHKEASTRLQGRDKHGMEQMGYLILLNEEEPEGGKEPLHDFIINKKTIVDIFVKDDKTIYSYNSRLRVAR